MIQFDCVFQIVNRMKQLAYGQRVGQYNSEYRYYPNFADPSSQYLISKTEVQIQSRLLIRQ